MDWRPTFGFPGVGLLAMAVVAGTRSAGSNGRSGGGVWECAVGGGGASCLEDWLRGMEAEAIDLAFESVGGGAETLDSSCGSGHLGKVFVA